MEQDSDEQIGTVMERVRRARTIQTAQLAVTIIGVLLVAGGTSELLTLLAVGGTLFGAVACWAISDKLLADAELVLNRKRAVNKYQQIKENLRED